MKLKQLMRDRSLSQQALGRQSGVSQPQISRIIRGQQPTLATLQKIAAALEVSVSELIGEQPKAG
jgi:transcriptional regulator with XRE-family HTH domain